MVITVEPGVYFTAATLLPALKVRDCVLAPLQRCIAEHRGIATQEHSSHGGTAAPPGVLTYVDLPYWQMYINILV